jgi:AcrR family transcriptional regulator
MTSRAEATRARLREAALDLFERRGYHEVTVEEIAAAAGVSHMTFFRHFATKERVLLDDPFDPVIADAVADQPVDLPAIERVARGMLSLQPLLDAELTSSARRGIAVAVGIPELEAGMAANTAATERAIVERAAPPGGRTEMRIAAAACLAAVTASMLEWAGTDRRDTLGQLLTRALTTVVPSLGSGEREEDDR